MSSVEIKIKGVKGVKGLRVKSKRGKAQQKKKRYIEKKKMEEYSYKGLPPSRPRIIPTYIDRPPAIQAPPQQQEIDYKPLFDRLSQQLYLAQQKTKSAQQQNIIPPEFKEAHSRPVLGDKIEITEIKDDEERKEPLKKKRRFRLVGEAIERARFKEKEGLD